VPIDEMLRSAPVSDPSLILDESTAPLLIFDASTAFL